MHSKGKTAPLGTPSGTPSGKGKGIVKGNHAVVDIPAQGYAEAVTERRDQQGLSSCEVKTAPRKETQVDSASQASSESSTGVATPEIADLSPARNKPPTPNANESFIRKRSLNRSIFSKPKSRFVEQQFIHNATMFEEEPNALSQEQAGGHSPFRDSFSQASPSNRSMQRSVVTWKLRSQEQVGGHSSFSGSSIQASPNNGSIPVNPQPTASVGPAERRATRGLSKAKHQITTKTLVECAVFFLFLGCLVVSLTVDQLEASKPWGLEIWKWCVLVMVLFSGMSVTNWVMHFIIFLIERKFFLQTKIIYFVDGIQVFTWLAFVLLTWVLLFNRGVKRSNVANKVSDYITSTLVSILIGSFLWFIKNLLLKILALSFHITTFFDRIRESIFHHYVLQTLFRRPLTDEDCKRMEEDPTARQFNFRTMKKGKRGEKEKVIDVEKILKMKQKEVSVLTMNMLVDAVRSVSLSNVLTKSHESDGGGAEQVDEETMTEEGVVAAACCIFKKVARRCECLQEGHLRRFMNNEDVDLLLSMFEGEGTGQINKISFTNWVVKVYQGHKALVYALIDTKTALKQLNKLVTGILIVTTIIIWLLLMEFATTNVLLMLSSQLVMAAFIFGDTCKKIFEGIIFVFVTRPFDVGDRCVIDSLQLMVEEMSILTTVFLMPNHDKIWYPNSVLATKPIINCRRSSDLGVKLEFLIEPTTPEGKIEAMEEEIKKYLKKNPLYWHLNPDVSVSEIENLNKRKMGLHVFHKMNFQDYAENNRRRTELLHELERIFVGLNIGYYLPREVHPLQSEDKKEA